jgi:hypothetical protein
LSYAESNEHTDVVELKHSPLSPTPETGQPLGDDMTASAGIATDAFEELAAASRAEPITAGDPGCDRAPQSLSQRC